MIPTIHWQSPLSYYIPFVFSVGSGGGGDFLLVEGGAYVAGSGSDGTFSGASTDPAEGDNDDTAMIRIYANRYCENKLEIF